jgi:uncharacterized protein YjbJ (UPF0337 family)
MKGGRHDRNKGARDNLRGRFKEATSSLTGNTEQKAKGGADQSVIYSFPDRTHSMVSEFT